MIVDTLLAKVIGTANDRELKRIRPFVAEINSKEAEIQRLSDDELRAQDRRVPAAARQRIDARRPDSRSVRRRPRSRPPRAEHAALRRPAHRRHRPPPRQDRRDEDRRRQDARRDAPGLSQRARGQGRPRRHGQRLPGPPRLGVDGPHLPLPRDVGRRHPARPERPGAPGRLRLRHHLRHEQRVRLRLPARQHEVRPRALRAARSPLRHRRRSRQHPHRRGADAAHHLGARRRVDRPATTRSTGSSRSSRLAPSRRATSRPRTAKSSRRPATTSSTRSTRPSR